MSVILAAAFCGIIVGWAATSAYYGRLLEQQLAFQKELAASIAADLAELERVRAVVKRCGARRRRDSVVVVAGGEG